MKYFVVSDMHSFTSELKKALKQAGFDKKNKNHTLIVCGDVFDRGSETVEMYKFLTSIPKSRCILVKGNHESLYLDLLKKRFPDSYDFSNHTVDTFCHIAGYSAEIMTPEYWYKLNEDSPYEQIQQAWQEILKEVKASKITEWIKSSQWKDYYELDKYIFVHSFIPLYNHNKFIHYYFANPFVDLVYIDKWRTIKSREIIEGSTWGCPWKNYLAGLFEAEAKKGKILVCGHWHCNDFYIHLAGKMYEELECYDIFRGRNIIALDACTARTRKVNVMIIKEDYEAYYIKNGKETKLEIVEEAL